MTTEHVRVDLVLRLLLQRKPTPRTPPQLASHRLASGDRPPPSCRCDTHSTRSRRDMWTHRCPSTSTDPATLRADRTSARTTVRSDPHRSRVRGRDRATRWAADGPPAPAPTWRTAAGADGGLRAGPPGSTSWPPHRRSRAGHRAPGPLLRRLGPRPRRCLHLTSARVPSGTTAVLVLVLSSWPEPPPPPRPRSPRSPRSRPVHHPNQQPSTPSPIPAGTVTPVGAPASPAVDRQPPSGDQHADDPGLARGVLHPRPQ